MEFTSLAARIDRNRKLLQETFVELASCEGRIQLLPVDAGYPGAYASGQHLAGETGPRREPQGKQGLQPGAAKSG